MTSAVHYLVGLVAGILLAVFILAGGKEEKT